MRTVELTVKIKVQFMTVLNDTIADLVHPAAVGVIAQKINRSNQCELICNFMAEELAS